jgi:Putative Ig domain
MFEIEIAIPKGHRRFSATFAQRLSILILLVAISLLTTSCGMPAQAAGAKSQATPHNLNVYGNLPVAKVHEPYNAVLAVGGGNFPYYFSVKTGGLPPGLTLNPVTGRFSGMPTTVGNYDFEVIVTDSPRLDEGIKHFSVVVGGGSGSGVALGLTPATVTLYSNQKQQFTATVSGTSNTGVTWSATHGSISASGQYTASVITAQTSALVTATSNADSTKSASSTITLEPLSNQTLKIATSSLSEAQQGEVYGVVFAATGGTAPYAWSISAGTPPPGITMNSNGDFAGIPNAIGTFNFVVMVSDALDKTATGNFSISVVAGSNFDGPAELPRATVPSAMSDTPAPGSVINVNAGGDLQAALNAAHCGDVIQLQAAATFTGQFSIPAKNCDINHWIIIRTSAADSTLPAEGQRATPCYAGVASLPGRPQYSCANAKNVMAKIQMPVRGEGPFQIAPGANYYRLIGLEVTRAAGTPGSAKLISSKGTVDHFIVDRSWLHGGLQDETQLGVNLSGMTSAAVVDSYFSDFHCISLTGVCSDAHAVAGGVSDTQDGPFKIQNNFLEASGEAVMFGGGAATLSPADIQILNNHFWKPWQWMPGKPNFIGGPDGHPFVVKNHLELKNAVRVLIEANLMENNWGGFSQSGYSILLNPKNQHTPSGACVCPLCQVTDVTVRYVHISHSASGILMATAISGHNNGAAALAGARWSIHDVVLDDISRNYVGGGALFLIMNVWPTHPLNTITINHVTGFPDPNGHVLELGNILASTAPMYGFVFTNNMVATGRYPVWNTGGTTSCAVHDVPTISISKCFTTYTFANNALVATPPAFPPSAWPAANLFPQTFIDAEFVNYNNGNGGNYALQPSSLYKNKGTDGKDLGADIVGLDAALANVE